ncbi:hypothetical protein Ddye_026962 [Dipteronia dyeriana]|uniref:Uncharacterized protein n=1 Tax=Dipteronia dyeriana TaxID=168575 RepID=A0AAD9WQW9_9ROSI|nr:hypothetical protein Ddye_026962 [Dipteronia dyeriana]
MDSGCSRWIFGTTDSWEFRKTGKVIDGAYDGAWLSCSDQAVQNGLDKSGNDIPLEIMSSSEFEPLYRTDGELPVLPLSVYGVVVYSTPYQFFFYLYDKRNAGIRGLSFDDEQFSVFGYIFKPLMFFSYHK